VGIVNTNSTTHVSALLAGLFLGTANALRNGGPVGNEIRLFFTDVWFNFFCLYVPGE